MEESAFIRHLAGADKDMFRAIAGRLYRYVADLATEGVADDDPERIHDDILVSFNRRTSAFDPAGLTAVVDRAFADMTHRVEAAGGDAAVELALGLRDIRRIVTGRIAFDGPPYAIMVAGPRDDDFPYSKLSASSRARDLQRTHRLAVQPLGSRDRLRTARGLIFEAPLAADEIMLAGEARGLGLEMVLIGSEELLPGVPTFRDPEEAFADLRSRIMSAPEAAEPFDYDDEEAIRVPGDRPGKDTVAAWRLRAEILEQAYGALIRRMTFSSDRQAAKSAELDRLIREEHVPEDVRTAYFEIVANGSRSGHGPDLARKINSMRHQIEALQERLDAETETPDTAP